LVEIDTLDLETAERALNFTPYARGRADLLRQGIRVGGIADEPGFGKGHLEKYLRSPTAQIRFKVRML
jgi:hypothetical protein